MAEPRTSGEPHDRLTHLCDRMTGALDELGDEVADVKCIVFLQDGERGGIQLHRYEDQTEAMAELFLHMQAVFESMGKTLMFAPLQGNPEKN